MSDPRVTRWARRLVAVGVLFFLAVHLAVAADLGRRPVVVLGLYGFVLHVLFGKAYALVPAYFDRDLALPWAPALQFPLSVVGTAGLVLVSAMPASVTTVGRVCWALGVVVFLGSLGWTLRTNLTGRETGTGGANTHRRGVDRVANAVVPVALMYLAAGAVAVTLPALGRQWLLPAQVSHLLGAGAAALFVFGVGFRLFPRFLVAEPPRPLVWLVLPAGAVAPALLAIGLFDRRLLLVGGILEALAVVGFAAAYVVMFRRSDRRRVGFYAVLAAVGYGVVGVGLALATVLNGRDPQLVRAHYRTMLLGFLGMTVIGATFQFYPPTVGRSRLSTDRIAAVTIGLLVVGLGGQLLGILSESPPLVFGGEATGVVGAGLYCWLLGAAFRRR
ncbi:hypothetical protein [Haloarcula halophila]|uniref:hypothetical protein n=1 Tax=Haloarcula TaxID=2237 RepID=UPI0023E3C7DD|nr:hypothetical protein [Halomicroarcula sp. DFY41]